MILKRQYECRYGYFGELKTRSGKIFYTLERPYLSNMRFISCVPPGEYELLDHNSVRHGQTIKLSNPDLHVYPNAKASGRYGILFHSANVVNELQGCIAPGLDIGVVSGQWAVLSSGEAMKQLRECWKDDRVLLIE
jgi:hypothetical protein